MIPAMIGLGLTLGRWPRTTLVVAAIGWPVLLFVTGPLQSSSNPVGSTILAALLAVANAGVGVLVHQAILWSVRLLRRRTAAQHSG